MDSLLTEPPRVNIIRLSPGERARVQPDGVCGDLLDFTKSNEELYARAFESLKCQSIKGSLHDKKLRLGSGELAQDKPGGVEEDKPGGVEDRPDAPPLEQAEVPRTVRHKGKSVLVMDESSVPPPEQAEMPCTVCYKGKSKPAVDKNIQKKHDVPAKEAESSYEGAE